MPAATKPPVDRREALLTAALKRHHYRPDALIEVLHKAQELFGCLDRERLLSVAKALKLPPSRVYGVATFYHLFSLEPLGEHTCSVCMGTACYVKGAGDIVAALESAWGVRAGQTRPDRKVSLSVARCIGACGLAPVAVIDGEVVGHLTAEQALGRSQTWGTHGPGGPEGDR